MKARSLVLGNLALAVAYGLLGWLGLRFAEFQPNASLVWPPIGLALAAILLRGPWMCVGVWLGAFAINWTTGLPTAAAATVATGNTLAPLAGAGWLLRRTPFAPSFAKRQDVLDFVAIAVVGCTTISATVGAVALTSVGRIDAAHAATVWLIWWLGDANGVLIVAPALLTWGARSLERPPEVAGRLEKAVAFAALAVSSVAAFGPDLGSLAGLRGVLATLPLPFLVWIALRVGPRATASALLAIWAVAIVATARRVGPFAHENVEIALAMHLIFMGIVTTTVMTLAANLAELHRTEEARLVGERRLRTVLDSISEGVWDWDLERDEVQLSGTWRASFGYEDSGEPDRRATWLDRIHRDDLPRVQAAVDALRSDASPDYECEFRVRSRDGGERWILDRGRVIERDAAGRPRRIAGAATDVTALKRAEEEARAAARFVTTVLDALPEQVAVLDGDGTILTVNERWRSSAAERGWADDQAGIGRNYLEVCDRAAADGDLDAEQIAHALRTVLEGERIGYATEYCCSAPGCDDSWFLMRASRFEFGGAPRGIVVHQDISARKRAEHEQALARDELDHRVKNTLALVAGLADRTAEGATSVDGYLDAFLTRIQAMARTHELLSDGSFGEVRIGEIVRAAMSGFEELPNHPVELDGPVTFVSAHMALPLTMALSELTTNAVKHGALSAPAGRVSVRWHVDASDRVRIEWTERDGPPVETRGTGGVGLRLVHDLVEEQLGGHVVLGFEPKGIEIQLTVPTRVRGEAEGTTVTRRPTPTPPSGPTLAQGARILVVEDDALQSRFVGRVLGRLGHEVVGPARDLARARELLAHEHVDGALLDLNLGTEDSSALAAELLAAGTPFLFATGHGHSSRLPEELRHVPRIAKPVEPAVLGAALERLLARVDSGTPGRDHDDTTRRG